MRSVSYGAYAAVRESLPWETRPSGGPAVFSSLGRAGLRRAWFWPGACRQLGGGVKGPSLVSPPATSRLGWSKKSLTEGGFRVIQSAKCREERRLGRAGGGAAGAARASEGARGDGDGGRAG